MKMSPKVGLKSQI